MSRASTLRPLTALAFVAALAGCATLPNSGPTRSQVERGARPDRNEIGFKLKDIDSAVVADVANRKSVEAGSQANLAVLAAAGRNDVIGPGDVLAISVYEVGVGLFGAGRVSSEGFDPSARGETFNAIVVDRDGVISLPYVGRLQVAGRTPGEVQRLIENGLRGLSQNPQAVVAVRENVSNTVYVAGDVRRPGRLDLSLRNERLLDAIASAGGSAQTAEDTVVRFNRGGRTVEQRLGTILFGGADDLQLLPGDRVELINRPRSYIVLGATSRASQVPFQYGELSLAEAIARAGGPTDTVADPSAIFVFRYETTPDGKGEEPIVYRLDLMRPTSYFLSQRFAVRDKDVVFIANAAANQPAKLVSILNQLFSPFITLRAVTRR